jgi:hypothetical protein
MRSTAHVLSILQAYRTYIICTFDTILQDFSYNSSLMEAYPRTIKLYVSNPEQRFLNKIYTKTSKIEH